MNKPTPSTPPAKLITYLLIIILLAAIGLLGYMIAVEDEPGALPLALILGSSALLFYMRRRKKTEEKN